ncbi:MAG: tRNA (guanosine(37)-N1)-methyltransferase TrmD [Tissierellia bacterium]|nr:tRNA (guanosine(37)-N1)-methyltransferase TrmD [Tissierellia bacterium]
MKIDVLTLFPEIFSFINEWSILGRAVADNKVTISSHNIRDFSLDKHKKVDDYPYGGGHGMVMMPQPVIDSINSVKSDDSHVIYLSPKGSVLTQEKLTELSKKNHLILLCGHYEGIDQRIIDNCVDEEISLGDYVLTGGELPAMVLIDGITRLLPEVLSTSEAYEEESHYNGLLEYPQYTRPAKYLGMEVPEVLISGHHANIKEYQERESMRVTYINRPDLLDKIKMTDRQKSVLKEVVNSVERRKTDGSN